MAHQTGYRVMGYDGDFKWKDRVGGPYLSDPRIHVMIKKKADAVKAARDWLNAHPPKGIASISRERYLTIEEVRASGTYPLLVMKVKDNQWHAVRGSLAAGSSKKGAARASVREPFASLHRLPMNREGLTYSEWLDAARASASLAARNAWNAGEDPSDWRAAKSGRASASVKVGKGKAAGSTFTVGQRVELHPGTDRWMMGDRYGEVKRINRGSVVVKLDRSGKVMNFASGNLKPITRYGMSKGTKGAAKGSAAGNELSPADRKKAEALLWKHTHADFKGKIDGVKMVLHNESGITYGTESWPISKFTDAQLLSKLPRRIRDDMAKGRAKGASS